MTFRELQLEAGLGRARKQVSLSLPKYQNPPDFDPIEWIWSLMKRRIQRHRGSERITTIPEMKKVLHEEWDGITIDEINKEIAQLLTTISRCLAVKGENNYYS